MRLRVPAGAERWTAKQNTRVVLGFTVYKWRLLCDGTRCVGSVALLYYMVGRLKGCTFLFLPVWLMDLLVLVIGALILVFTVLIFCRKPHALTTRICCLVSQLEFYSTYPYSENNRLVHH
ncbi:hypothetical protein NPIL_623461 [Nephila pilipes]|uniref:Uncharacterized protein n=1 Tax=Nephila pilipes TaxID=299642 RepID=A0A8X6Q2N1_NEPPI|nr:hypothetical protein NPIL_623461 [Nephila pilipes]